MTLTLLSQISSTTFFCPVLAINASILVMCSSQCPVKLLHFSSGVWKYDVLYLQWRQMIFDKSGKVLDDIFVIWGTFFILVVIFGGYVNAHNIQMWLIQCLIVTCLSRSAKYPDLFYAFEYGDQQIISLRKPRVINLLQGYSNITATNLTNTRQDV